ncbi:hypothetical protein IJG72_06165 [bacterium]|nr:hypothetical protein [bacterium]
MTSVQQPYYSSMNYGMPAWNPNPMSYVDSASAYMHSPSVFSTQAPSYSSNPIYNYGTEKPTVETKYPWNRLKNPESRKRCRDEFLNNYINFLQKCVDSKPKSADTAESSSESTESEASSQVSEASKTTETTETTATSETATSQDSAKPSNNSEKINSGKKTEASEILRDIYSITETYSGYIDDGDNLDAYNLECAVKKINQDNVIEVMRLWNDNAHYTKSTGDDGTIIDRIRKKTEGELESRLETYIMQALYDRAVSLGLTNEAKDMKNIVENELKTGYIDREKIGDAMKDLYAKIESAEENLPTDTNKPKKYEKTEKNKNAEKAKKQQAQVQKIVREMYNAEFHFESIDNAPEIGSAVGAINKNNVIEVISEWNNNPAIQKSSGKNIFQYIDKLSDGHGTIVLQRHMMRALYDRAKNIGLTKEADAMKKNIDKEHDSFFKDTKKIHKELDKMYNLILNREAEIKKQANATSKSDTTKQSK